MANVNSVRHMTVVVTTVAGLAFSGFPVTAVPRNLIDPLHFLGRDNTLRAFSQRIRRHGLVYVQGRTPKLAARSGDGNEPVGKRHPDLWEVIGCLEHDGLEIVDTVVLRDLGSSGSTLSYIIRWFPAMSFLTVPKQIPCTIFGVASPRRMMPCAAASPRLK